MRDAVICEPIRTAVGAFGGALKDVPVTTLASTVVRELVRRTGIESDGIDDVILGQGYPNGEAAALGRIAALDAGLDISVPGLQIDRRCGSGLQAILFAAMQIQTGVSDAVIAGGADNMSQVEYAATEMRWGVRGNSVQLNDRLARARVTAGGTNYPIEGGMIETAENLRREFSISREAQDHLALTSQLRAAMAIESGIFDDEIVPVSVPARGRTPEQQFIRDEHPRPDTTFEKLSQLKPIMSRQDPDATVTAGNASGQNDGAAVALVTTLEKAEALGLRPFARLVGWAVTGCDPRTMGLGPVSAVDRVMARTGLTLADMDLIEINEAFASQVLACAQVWGFVEADFDRVNVNGSGIALGHPIGATGGRILATMLREQNRREVRYSLETMCIGGGQGIAAIFERWQ